jgi:hypothetical protein
MISERRRQTRELAAMSLAATNAEPSPEWERVRPILDAAIDELPQPDRAAVVLRFLEQRPFAEIGSALQISADAARMRTDRALEKLRATLAKQGITSTAAALGTLLSTHSIVAAPPGLATILAPAALGAASASIAGSFASTGIFLVSTKLFLSGVGLAVALGLGFYLGLSRSVSEPLPPVPETPQQVQLIAALRKENAGLRAEVERLAAAQVPQKTAAQPPAPVPPPTRAAAMPAPLPALTQINQQRAMLNNLRMLTAASDQFIRDNKRPPTSLDELVGETKYIRQLNPVAGENYAGFVLDGKTPLTVTTPDGMSVTYDPNGKFTTDLNAAAQAAQAQAQEVLIQRFGREFVQRVTGSIQMAATAYSAANNGKRPPTLEAALPYFANPQEGADFLEFAEVAKALGMKF